MKKKDPTVNAEGMATRTRRTIVKLLKQEGSLDALQLAKQLDVSGMAVRQHLYNLQEQQLVTYVEEPRTMGRPAKMWRLTPEANRLFPDGHGDLVVSLIESMKEAFDEEGLEKLLEIRNQKQVAQYKNKLAACVLLHEKLIALAECRTSEGYMAEVAEHTDGSFSFVEKHCPICEAAKACSGFCSKELEMFQQVLGNDVEVERISHMLSGSNRCVYAIKTVN
ncbi:helix-turn-helix transcriptional regulator [Paenibacillus alba]|uniref:Transcriptional regulator n=1 Tax=Paenibacillus alba TaxID=1197127 RepID=A0ABU6G1A8_9BACL|nr:metalloregulator ArsR/SmtB family transcription factor [Paenibacillus alba]MEC0227760.1 transcriptional regulator [Paenibacillus alba]